MKLMSVHKPKTHENAKASLDARCDLNLPQEHCWEKRKHEIRNDRYQCLGDNDPLLLGVSKAVAWLVLIPGFVNGMALKDPQQGQDDIGHYQKYDGRLDWPDVSPLNRDT